MSTPTTDLTPWQARELRRIYHRGADGAWVHANVVLRGHRSMERAGLIEITAGNVVCTPEGRKVAGVLEDRDADSTNQED